MGHSLRGSWGRCSSYRKKKAGQAISDMNLGWSDSLVDIPSSLWCHWWRTTADPPGEFPLVVQPLVIKAVVAVDESGGKTTFGFLIGEFLLFVYSSV